MRVKKSRLCMTPTLDINGGVGSTALRSGLDCLRQCCEQAVTGWATTPYDFRVNPCQQSRRIANFVIFLFLCLRRGTGQSVLDRCFPDPFEVLNSGKGAFQKVLTKVGRYGCGVSCNPCFHCLDHEMDRVLADPCQAPSIAMSEMGLWRKRIGDWLLRVHQKDVDRPRGCPGCMQERIVRIIPASTSDNLPMKPLLASGLSQRTKKLRHASAQTRLPFDRIAATFHVHRNPAHGLPPSSPMRQISPS